ncbi:MAG: DUF1214 domain-containing protein [Pseudomonadota bacterium]
MRIWMMVLAAIIVTAGSAFAAFRVTMAELTDETSIYDSFERTDSLWLFSDKIGSTAASGVERAKVAIAGPLGLSAQEAVYFIATTDTEGRALSSSCTYTVTGPQIDTRWWSLTLYDTQTQHYVPNALNRSSWNSAVVPRRSDGSWQLTVANSTQPEPWLPSQQQDDQTFELNLRVYNPSDATRQALPNIDLPTVERASC